MNFKRAAIYVAACSVSIVVMTTIFSILLFPYQKAFMIAFENYLVTTNMHISMQDVSSGIASVKVSKILLGHKDIDNKPLIVLNNLNTKLDFFSVLNGTLNASMQSDLYGGRLTAVLFDIPFIHQKKTVLNLTIADVDLAKYPEDTFNWLKKISGILNGSIKNTVSIYEAQNQKGIFSFELKDGELTELKIKGLPKVILPYQKILINGKIEGTKYLFDNITAEALGVKFTGTGYADVNELHPFLNINVKYEAISKQAPIKGKGNIVITGTPLRPELKLQTM